MRALVCNAYGSTDDLLIEERDDPIAGDGQVAIDIKSAGINFPDILAIAGKYQDKTSPPFVPGNELAGVITAVGPNVAGFAVGDKLIAAIRGDAFAEKCVASTPLVMPLPPDRDFEQGADLASELESRLARPARADHQHGAGKGPAVSLSVGR